MKYLFFALVLLSACTWQVSDTRDAPTIAATRTALSALPYSANEGRLFVRVLLPVPTIAPQVAPNEMSKMPTVTPTPKASE